MTIGEKIAKARKENNYTQEQLADILSVSRQSISKWESNLAYPETDKLIRISELFHCSLDYLLKDSIESEDMNNRTFKEEENTYLRFQYRVSLQERKSEKTLWGMPLWHIGKNAKGIIAIGVKAHGVIAIGLKASGLISIGLLSLGVISLGTVSLGLLSLGMLAIGLFSAGCFSFGIFATGCISLGILSLGAIAIGDFSAGALAIGKYIALGDDARAMIAVGDTNAVGSLFQKIGDLTSSEAATIHQLLDENVPSYLAWAKDFIEMLLPVINGGKSF